MNVTQIAHIAQAKANQLLGSARVYFEQTTPDDTLTEVLDISVPEDSSSLLEIHYTGFDTALALAGRKKVLVRNVTGTVTVTDFDTVEENQLSTAAVSVATDGATVQVNVTGLDGSTINWFGYYELLTVINAPTV
jgi:hypothetical protein